MVRHSYEDKNVFWREMHASSIYNYSVSSLNPYRPLKDGNNV